MSLFGTATATDAGINISVDSVFEGLETVFGFCRTIIDFLKGIFTPLFEGLFESLLG